MFQTGLVELATEKPKRFQVSQFGRETMELVLLALRWEARHRPEREIDLATQVAGALIVAVGLAEPGEGTEGVVALTVSGDQGHSGLTVLVAEGQVQIASLLVPGAPKPTAWVQGDVDAWFGALLEGNQRGLHVGGSGALAKGLLDSLFGWMAP